MDRLQTGHHVVDLALSQGFGLCGIAPAAPSPHAAYIREWLAAGSHGEMGYLKDHLDLRLDPGRLVDGAASVIVVADRYASDAPSQPAQPAGRLARYAWGRDYHKVIKKRLHHLCDALAVDHPAHTFRAAVDTAPVLERESAVAAGLGWIGKHTLMIHPKHGSWFLLGVIVTTLDLPTSADLGHPGHTYDGTNHCGSCTRCIDACPTDAIAAGGYQLEATRCISYLTLEHRSAIADDLIAGIGDWVGGCDICQEVCPHNSDRGGSPEGLASDSPPLPVLSDYAPRTTSIDLLDAMGWTGADRQQAFRGSALKRMKLEMVKRNALIAAGNALAERDHPAIRQRIEALANDDTEHALVRDTAKQVLRLLLTA